MSSLSSLAPPGKPSGCLIDTLKCGPMDLYKVRFPQNPSENIVHPGRMMPTIMNTSQALFGVAPNKCGSYGQLKTLSENVPANAPRYLTHDVFSLDASLFSNFRKTAITYGDDRSEKIIEDRYKSQIKRDYPRPPPNSACATCMIRPGHKMPPPRTGDDRRARQRALHKINRPHPDYFKHDPGAPVGAGRAESFWRLA